MKFMKFALTSTSVLENEQVMAEQRKMLTQSMTRNKTPNTTQSHNNQLGPSSQSPVLAAIEHFKNLESFFPTGRRYGKKINFDNILVENLWVFERYHCCTKSN